MMGRWVVSKVSNETKAFVVSVALEAWRHALWRSSTTMGGHSRTRAALGARMGVGALDRFLVAIAEGSHPIPSRTRKLSPPASMVLQGTLCGRVERRQIYGPAVERQPALLLFKPPKFRARAAPPGVSRWGCTTRSGPWRCCRRGTRSGRRCPCRRHRRPR